MKSAQHILYSLMFLFSLNEGSAQIPVMLERGTACMPDEQYYMERLNEPLFPIDEMAVNIINIDTIPCFPDGIIASDLYTPEVIPYYHPLSGIYLTDVYTEPMHAEVLRTVEFTNSISNFSASINHSVIQWKFKPVSTDPLAQPYIYIESGIIDFAAIYNAINTHPGTPHDFTDGCDGTYNLGSLDMGTDPDIINTYPWGNGSRAVLYWRLNNNDHWYIQHVFMNDSPYIYNCTFNNDTLVTNFCQFDQEAPTFTFVPADLWLSCYDGIPGPSFPQAYDEISSEVTLTFFESLNFMDCESSFIIYRYYTATDVCGNSSTVTQIINVFDNTPPVFTDPPENTEVPADASLPNPGNTEVVDDCSEIWFNYGFLIDGAVIEVTMTGIDDCGNSVTHTFTVNALPPSFFPADSSQFNFTINLGDEIPEPLDLETLSENNIYFYFTMDEDTVFTQFRDDVCTVYSIKRTYHTYNLVDELIDDFTFIQNFDIIDVTPPVLEIGADTVVTETSSIPEPEYTASDDYGNPVVEITTDTIPGDCEFSFTLERTYAAIDSCGNISSDVQIIEVDGDCNITSLPTVTRQPDILVFPNPGRDIFFIQTGFEQFQTIVYDLNGRKIAEQRHNSKNSKLDLSHVPNAGILIVQVIFENGSAQLLLEKIGY